MSYDIIEHKHRFAAWAASRAASAKNSRFKVSAGKAILEQLGLKQLVDAPNLLPEPAKFDAWHHATCTSAIKIALEMKITLNHGSVAKLLNMYLKILFSCGGHENHARVAAIHPPIDNLLLNGLLVRDLGPRTPVWKKAKTKGWSKFLDNDYTEVIINLRDFMGGQPLWMAEEFWQGHQ